MIQVRPIFVREAALLLAELAEKATARDGFLQALQAARPDGPRPSAWSPQPDRATGFPVHHILPDGPERPAPKLALATYAARVAERVVLEGPVAGLSLRV